VGLAIKPLMVPLLAWLLLTRRFRAAFAATAVTLALTLGSWAAIGFSGLRSYPDLLQAWDRAYQTCGVSLSALALKLGAGDVLATSIRVAAAGALLVCSWRLAQRADGDRRSFLVPLVLVAPRLERRWLVLAALWLLGPDDSLRMRLVHVDGRVVPTATEVGSNSYLILIGYLLITAAAVLVTVRPREGRALGWPRRAGSLPARFPA
jgi:hypothetical protein